MKDISVNTTIPAADLQECAFTTIEMGLLLLILMLEFKAPIRKTEIVALGATWEVAVKRLE